MNFMNTTTYILPPGTTSVHRTPATLVAFCDAFGKRKCELHRINHPDGRQEWEVWSDRSRCVGLPLAPGGFNTFDNEDEARRDFRGEMLHGTNGFDAV